MSSKACNDNGLTFVPDTTNGTKGVSQVKMANFFMLICILLVATPGLYWLLTDSTTVLRNTSVVNICTTLQHIDSIMFSLLSDS